MEDIREKETQKQRNKETVRQRACDRKWGRQKRTKMGTEKIGIQADHR